ncbi:MULTISPECIES: cytochrome c/FTR1 family iron permease [Sphingobium]|jgi:high-affinity iron transporter|uniref:cytochrome c/FTR1 family iron permease n=1 Tax=Sphingobium sp. MI1205 TaxID=407020 RepID=UPI00076FFA7E|nr:iron permease [Sphingobium sp. MI1205]MBU0555386.1 cytochrome c/FTR1 family iron permease [Alphaproteobacteria bacterium]MBU0793044.1 cytochrome c/FTR1 family iron permease [Alphaproteobacteria bacterium]MBU0877652.1 cytochrome c/FTR1 family iron permease [Alphaproteobacteria bacterium]MBU1770164.1 cytochrome c/FTR1 family iron permease [Alphaproteobacteria bacterium]
MRLYLPAAISADFALGRRSTAHLVALALILIVFALPGRALASDADVQTSWRLLDYIGVDYAGAVSNGKVISSAEYGEMTEFASQVESRLKALPAKPAKAALLERSAALRSAIAAKAAPAVVAEQSHLLASALLAAYPVPLAPSSPPDLSRGAKLYAENCASCHGMNGDGRGPDAAKLDPPPIAFTDKERADQRSLFGLYQVITQGLDGTAMQSFEALPEGDRWALAFYVGHFAYPETAATQGERLWRERSDIRSKYPNLAALVGATPAALARDLSPKDAVALTAFLRRHPDTVTARAGGSLALTRERLAESLTAYRAGDRKAAAELALSAYLDGFEPVEPVLSARDAALLARIETGMAELRAAIGQGRPAAEVEAANRSLANLFADAETALAPERASGASSFLGAFGVLLREGLEALLIVVAMIAFLKKTDRPDVLGYVHGGWVVALAAGVATWFAATYFITVSGASRELTEGFGSLFAAVILLSVGIWMHGKSNAEAWQRYVKAKVTAALSRRSGWFLFLLSFVVVYREVFETILFYAALWAEGNGAAMLAGAATAAGLLAVIAWIMLRYSARLPITQFFAWSSILIAILAVVLAGKGIAGLQEAGILGVRPLVDVPRIEILGLFPTKESVLAQIAAIVVLAAGFWFSGRRSAASASATSPAK